MIRHLLASGLLCSFAYCQCNEGCNVIFEISGETPGDQFGWQAASVGDVNGDGIADFYVTANQNDAAGTDSGRAYVYSGASGQELFRMTGTRPNERFGEDCDPIGDLDGDGVTELLISAPWNGPGHASIFSGANGGFIKELTGELQGSAFGYRVASIGDLDGDATPDYAASAIFVNANGANSGRVYLYSGLESRLIATLDGRAAGVRFGTAIEVVGDLNGDGRDEFVVGADNDGPNAEGRAYVYTWNGNSVDEVFALEPPANARDFGLYFVDGGLDMTCDDVPDIYIGDFVGNRAYVYSGADGGLIHTFSGDGNGQFGLGEIIDDINRDGYADLVLAAWVSNRGAPQAGKVFVYSGQDGSRLRSMTHTVAQAQFGFDAKGISDLNGDGYPDFVIAAANALSGRGTVYVIAGEAYDDPEVVCSHNAELSNQWLYPWISFNSQYESLIVANNLGDTTAQVQFTAQRETGPAAISEVLTIPAHGFLRLSPRELFPGLESGPGMTVVLASDAAQLAGRWVTNNLNTPTGASPSQAVAIPLQGSQVADLGTSLLFGYLPQNNGLVASPVVVHVGAEPTDINLEFFDSAGELVHQMTLSQLSPMHPFARVMSDLVPGNTENLSMVATSNAPLAGLVFVFNSFSETAIGNASSLQAISSNQLVYSWVSSNAQYESIVVVNNQGTDTAEIMLQARRSDGSSEIAGPFHIAASGFLEQSASELFPQLGSGPGYTVQVTSIGGQIWGRWVTNNLESASGRSPSQAVAIDPNQEDRYHGGTMEFGFLPVEGGMTSAPAIVSLADAPMDVTLRFYNLGGDLIKEDTLAGLNPYQPFAAVVPNLVGTQWGDLSLVVTAIHPLTGVSFVFNRGSEPAMGNATAVSSPP